MNTGKKYIFTGAVIYFACLLSLCTLDPTTLAGNKSIIEERVQELDTVNKLVIEKIPDLPENGTLSLTAKVLNKEWIVDFIIQDQNASGSNTKSGTITFGSDQLETSETKEGTIDFGSNFHNNQQESSQPERGLEKENE
ncbi:MAG: hypothetical protein GY941_12590 [Planctomycetes bacterium]|nr:hypothetical protein [Planctomycetota bacterium]